MTKLKTLTRFAEWNAGVDLPNTMLAFQIPVLDFSSKHAHSQSHGIWLNTQGPQLHTAHLAVDRNCSCRFYDKVGNASLDLAEHP